MVSTTRAHISAPASGPSVPVPGSAVSDQFDPVTLSMFEKVSYISHIKLQVPSMMLVPPRFFKDVFKV